LDVSHRCHQYVIGKHVAICVVLCNATWHVALSCAAHFAAYSGGIAFKDWYWWLTIFTPVGVSVVAVLATLVLVSRSWAWAATAMLASGALSAMHWMMLREAAAMI